MLQLITVLFFCQVWMEVGGFTVRAEDVLILGAWLMALLSTLLRQRLVYRTFTLSWPLLAWMAVLLVGALVTFLRPLPTDIKKDGVVNAVRLILALSTFFLMLNHSADPWVKMRATLKTVIGFSFITTLVCIAQIAYWDGWVNLPLPETLTQLREGADDEAGREIFGLFLGNSGTHIWAGMLAVQALAVLSVGRVTTNKAVRYGLYFYFVVLALIIVRTSVRNSILGLGVAVFVLFVVRALKSKYAANRLPKILLVALASLAVVIGLFQVAPDSYFVERIRRAIPQVQDGRIVIHPGSNLFGRIEFAQIALDLFAEQPIVGQGFFAYATLARERTIFPVVHAHNSYFQALAELGLIGFVVLLWLLWTIGRNIWRIYNVPSDDPLVLASRNWLLGVAVFTAFTALFSNPLWEPQQTGLPLLLSGALLHWYGGQVVHARRRVELAIKDDRAVPSLPTMAKLD